MTPADAAGWIEGEPQGGVGTTSIAIKLEFEGAALQTPANRDFVEHLAKVLRTEAEAYAASHSGTASIGAPRHRREEISEEGIGEAGAGWIPERHTVHRALVEGSAQFNDG